MQIGDCRYVNRERAERRRVRSALRQCAAGQIEVVRWAQEEYPLSEERVRSV